jgi:hypothetical protein
MASRDWLQLGILDSILHAARRSCIEGGRTGNLHFCFPSNFYLRSERRCGCVCQWQSASNVSPMRSGARSCQSAWSSHDHMSRTLSLPVSTRCHGAARLQGGRVVLRMQLSSITASMVISEWTRISTSSQLPASTYRYVLPGGSSIPLPALTLHPPTLLQPLLSPATLRVMSAR